MTTKLYSERKGWLSESEASRYVEGLKSKGYHVEPADKGYFIYAPTTDQEDPGEFDFISDYTLRAATESDDEDRPHHPSNTRESIMRTITTTSDLWTALSNAKGQRLIVEEGGLYTDCLAHEAGRRRVVAKLNSVDGRYQRLTVKRATDAETAIISKWLADWS